MHPKPRRTPSGSMFCHVVETGNILRIKKLLAYGADINAPGDGTRTPLIAAIQNHQMEAASLLIDLGCTIDAQMPVTRTTALMAAAIAGGDMAKIAANLIFKGANLDLPDQNGMTVLMRCSWGVVGSHETLKLLLQQGADPHLRNAEGKTALDLARFTNNRTAIDLLTDDGLLAENALVRQAKLEKLRRDATILQAPLKVGPALKIKKVKCHP